MVVTPDGSPLLVYRPANGSDDGSLSFTALRSEATRLAVTRAGNEAPRLASANLRILAPVVLSDSDLAALTNTFTASDLIAQYRQAGFDGAVSQDRMTFVAFSDDQVKAVEEYDLRNRRNYRISDARAASIGEGNDRQKINQNIDTLILLKSIASEDREATPEERAKLAGYVDFGGLRTLWDQGFKYREEHRRLGEVLTMDELLAVKETSINTHYTSIEVVDEMWRAASRLGYSGGRILEPGMGVGNFYGRIPEDLAAHSELLGIEKNIISGRMAKILYPDARITVKPYEEVRVPNNTLDMVIGNPPFAEIKVFDPEYSKPRLSLHNYFIVKSLDKLKAGGIAALVTTHYTLDSQGDEARQEMAKRADLVAAIRLPNNAFAVNAGTKVTTDILFFRKRGPNEPQLEHARWLETVNVPVVESDPEVYPEPRLTSINAYFADHPEMVLGHHSLTGSQYRRDEYTLEPSGDLRAQLAAAIDRLPAGIFGMVKHDSLGLTPAQPERDSQEFAPEHVKEGAYYIDNGTVYIKRSGQREALPDTTKGPALYQIKSLIGLRDAVTETIRVQRDGGSDSELEQVQAVLGARYDAYRESFGPLTANKTRKVFEDDPEYPLLTALENIDPLSEAVSKADIFFKRTTRPYSPLRELPSDPKAAMLKVMAEKGRLDIEMMARLLHRTEASIVESLSLENLIYQDPATGEYVQADEYLSGNVRRKLAQAREAVSLDPSFARNIAQLEAVQPEPISIVDIDARLGQTWIPREIYARFIHEHLAGNTGRHYELPSITRDQSGRWYVQLPRSYNEFALEHEWKAGNLSGDTLVEYALNQQQPSVYLPPDEDGRRQLDVANTAAARFKTEEIKSAFKTWIKGDSLASEHARLEKLYNDAHNSVRLRTFDGSHLDFPGLNLEKTPRPYQSAYVWRIVQDGRALNDHFVGGGKTLENIIAGMELRRTGLSNKNLYVVPNNMVPQWREDFKNAYPTARVLAVTDADLRSAAARRRLFARVATNDWDAVIVPHSQFNMLPISPERERITIARQKAELKEVLEEAKLSSDRHSASNRRSTRQMEVAMQKYDARLKELSSGRKDNTVYFDDLGIDALFIDEAHAYKALPFATKMGNISGLSTRRSQRAQNVLAKIDYMYDTHNKRGVVFMTGTSITNTLGEAYTMNRYIAPDLLENAGIRNFDDWAANYAETTTKHEYAVDGSTIRPKTSLSTFVNVPELRQLWAQFADVVTQEQAVAAGYIKVPTPNRIDVLVTVTPEQEPMLQEIAERGEKLMLPMSDPDHPDPSVDNWLKLDGDARDVSLDPRMRDSFAGDNPDSKVNNVVRLVRETYDQTMEDRGIVVIFSDRYATADGRFNIFTDIKHKLVKQGIPEEAIAIVHDYPKREQFAALQAAARKGDVRVVMGTTEKLGIGVNIQTRLKREIHVDMPQRPDQLEQREGRAIRYGNIFDNVDIVRLITKPRDINAPKAHDLQRAQLLERKQTFLTQFKTAGSVGRRMEDVAGDVRLSPEMFALAKAQATGNPLALEKIKLESEIRNVGLLDRSAQMARHLTRQELGQLELAKAQNARLLAQMTDDLKTMQEHEVRDENDKLVSFRLQIGKKVFTEMKEANEFLKAGYEVADGMFVSLNGVPISITVRTDSRFNLASGMVTESTNAQYSLCGEWFDAPKGEAGRLPSVQSLVASLMIRSRDLPDRIDRAERFVQEADVKRAKLKLELEKKSPYQQTLEDLNRRLTEVQAELMKDVKEENVIGDVELEDNTPGVAEVETPEIETSEPRPTLSSETQPLVGEYAAIAEDILIGEGTAEVASASVASKILDHIFDEPRGTTFVKDSTKELSQDETKSYAIKQLFDLTVTSTASGPKFYLSAHPGKTEELVARLRAMDQKQPNRAYPRPIAAPAARNLTVAH